MKSVRTIKEINELAKQAYANSIAHGFWEEKHSNKHCLCLVVGELMEAVEADRLGRRADMVCWNTCMINARDGIVRPDWYDYSFRHCIKDTVEDELADAVILLFVLMAARDCYLEPLPQVQCTMISKDNSFTENIFGIVAGICFDYAHVGSTVELGIFWLIKLAELYEIDLWWHVEAKMRFNANREYKHGKQY